MAGFGTGATGRRDGRLRRGLRGLLPVAVALALLSLVQSPASATTTTTGSVTPLLDCVTQNSNGTFTGVVGYTSTYAQTKTIPVGSSNVISPSTYNGKQPTTFKPGTQHGVYAVTVSAYDGIYGHPTWYLDGHYLSPGWDTTLSPSCPLPTQLPADGNGAGAGIVLVVAGIVGVLVVLRVRRRALAADAPQAPTEEHTGA